MRVHKVACVYTLLFHEASCVIAQRLNARHVACTDAPSVPCSMHAVGPHRLTFYIRSCAGRFVCGPHVAYVQYLVCSSRFAVLHLDFMVMLWVAVQYTVQ